MQALRINTLSKLTYTDSERFDALLQDVFPGVEFRDIEYETLRNALKEVCAESHLGVIDSQVWRLIIAVSSVYCVSDSDMTRILVPRPRHQVSRPRHQGPRPRH